MVMCKYVTCKRHSSDLNLKSRTMTPLFMKVGVFFLTKPMMYEEASGNIHHKTSSRSTVQACLYSEILRVDQQPQKNRSRVPVCKGGAFWIELLHLCSSAEGNTWSQGLMSPGGLGFYSRAITVTPCCALSMKEAYIRSVMVTTETIYTQTTTDSVSCIFLHIYVHTHMCITIIKEKDTVNLRGPWKGFEGSWEGLKKGGGKVKLLCFN